MTPSELKAWRINLSLTQTEAADLIGYTLNGYYKLETGRRVISRTVEILTELLAKQPSVTVSPEEIACLLRGE